MRRTFHYITSRIWFYWVVGQVCSSWNMDVAWPGALPGKLDPSTWSMQKLWCLLATASVGAHNPQGWAGKPSKQILQTRLHFGLLPPSLLQWSCRLVGGNPFHPNWSSPFLNCVRSSHGFCQWGHSAGGMLRVYSWTVAYANTWRGSHSLMPSHNHPWELTPG